MTTLEKIEMDGAVIIGKLKRGIRLTKDEEKVLSIYNSLHSGKSFIAGKRKIIKTGT